MCKYLSVISGRFYGLFVGLVIQRDMKMFSSRLRTREFPSGCWRIRETRREMRAQPLDTSTVNASPDPKTAIKFSFFLLALEVFRVIAHLLSTVLLGTFPFPTIFSSSPQRPLEWDSSILRAINLLAFFRAQSPLLFFVNTFRSLSSTINIETGSSMVEKPFPTSAKQPVA
jgi:hypothetical protein